MGGNRSRSRGNRNDEDRGGDRRGNQGGGKYRRNKYEEWEKEMTITLDTEIPEIPKEKMPEPSNDELRKELKAISKQIDDMRNKIDKLKDKRVEALDIERKERLKAQGDLKGLFKEVKDLNNKIA